MGAEFQHAESSRGNPDLSRPIHGLIGWFGGIRRIHAPHESGHFFAAFLTERRLPEAHKNRQQMRVHAGTQ